MTVSATTIDARTASTYERPTGSKNEPLMPSMKKTEPDLVQADEPEFIAHVLVVPSTDPEERKRHDAEIEKLAMLKAIGFEETYRTPAEGAPEHVEVRALGLTLGIASVVAARDVHEGRSMGGVEGER